MSAFQFLTAWLLMIAMLAMLSSTEWGKSIVYYLLWLAVVLLLVTHTEELKSLMPTAAYALNG